MNGKKTAEKSGLGMLNMKKILDISWVGPSSVCAQCMDFTPVVHDDPLYGDGKVVAREITVHCTNETLCSRLVEQFKNETITFEK